MKKTKKNMGNKVSNKTIGDRMHECEVRVAEIKNKWFQRVKK